MLLPERGWYLGRVGSAFGNVHGLGSPACLCLRLPSFCGFILWLSLALPGGGLRFASLAQDWSYSPATSLQDFAGPEVLGRGRAAFAKENRGRSTPSLSPSSGQWTPLWPHKGNILNKNHVTSAPSSLSVWGRGAAVLPSSCHQTPTYISV